MDGEGRLPSGHIDGDALFEREKRSFFLRMAELQIIQGRFFGFEETHRMFDLEFAGEDEVFPVVVGLVCAQEIEGEEEDSHHGRPRSGSSWAVM